MTKKRLGVVLFNLGGPQNLSQVKPFLFNLFYDPAIIQLPNPFRYMLAWLISSLRHKKAQGIYERLGGGSPLYPNTLAQAKALTAALEIVHPDAVIKVFTVMRYCAPRLDDVMPEIASFDPTEIVLLPLYPQCSTTTTVSSFDEWDRFSTLTCPTRRVGCYPLNVGFVRAQADLLTSRLPDDLTHVRILFAAHGLPQSIVDAGDPYHKQVEATAAAILEAAGLGGLDAHVCYQSRVGPKKWLQPYADVMIEEASRAGKIVVVVPLSFVSEHSETLVELDQDYKELAQNHGALGYIRIPTVSVHPGFIEGLVSLINNEEQPTFACAQDRTACYCRKKKNVS